MTIDFKKEIGNLKERREFFNPEIGKNVILFKDNGSEIYQTTYKGKTINKIDFKIIVEGTQNDQTLSVRVGGTGSLYGKIVKFGSMTDDNSLIGKTITLLRSGNGLETRYEILETFGENKKLGSFVK